VTEIKGRSKNVHLRDSKEKNKCFIQEVKERDRLVDRGQQIGQRSSLRGRAPSEESLG